MRRLFSIFVSFGDYTLFVLNFLANLSKVFTRGHQILKQMKIIGYDSFILICITSAFTGLVTAVQTVYQTSGYVPNYMIGIFIGKTTLTELAPALTGLVLCGKIGASIAAEIGSMKISEQIDALKSMAIDPMDFIFMPKIVAGAIMVPILTALADIISILSAFILSYLKHGIDFYSFFGGMRDNFLPSDLWGGLVKAFFFGIIITSIGCFVGMKTKGGAQGVGVVAMQAVVYSSISILIMDFVVATILFGG